MRRHLIIGERRSPTAIARGLRWEDERLCADTLHRALRAAGIEPTTDCRFENLFRDDDPTDWAPDWSVLAAARHWVASGGRVVALGRRVSRALLVDGTPHVRLIHPAARGVIRRTERYQAHVRAALA